MALADLLTVNKKRKKKEEKNMNFFVICFILAALLYVLMLPFVGKRAKKAHRRRN